MKHPTKLKITLLILLGLLVPLLVIKGDPFPRTCGKGSGTQQISPPTAKFSLEKRIVYDCIAPMPEVRGIVLHHTATFTATGAIWHMQRQELFVQILIDRQGNVYQLTNTIPEKSAGATGANSWAVNVEIVGRPYQLLKSVEEKDVQFQAVVETVRALQEVYNIPTNSTPPADVNDEWRGIFSHEDIDQLHPLGGRRGKKDPPGVYMEAVMKVLPLSI